jgi:hypothetical protein
MQRYKYTTIKIYNATNTQCRKKIRSQQGVFSLTKMFKIIARCVFLKENAYSKVCFRIPKLIKPAAAAAVPYGLK